MPTVQDVRETIQRFESYRWKRFIDRLDHNRTHNPKLFWDVIKRIRGKHANSNHPLRDGQHIVYDTPGKDASDPQNYRPISLTSTLAKLMEKVLVSRLHVYMRNRNLLPTTQAGFRPGAQLHDQLIRVLTPIEEAYTRRHYSILIALDAKRAFDTVWIDALKYKLTSLNLPHEITRWLSSFISNRTGQFLFYFIFYIPLTLIIYLNCDRTRALLIRSSNFVNIIVLCTKAEPSVYSQSRLKVEVITNSIELMSIVRSRNMFAFSSDERAFHIESYFRTGASITLNKKAVRKYKYTFNTIVLSSELNILLCEIVRICLVSAQNQSACVVACYDSVKILSFESTHSCTTGTRDGSAYPLPISASANDHSNASTQEETNPKILQLERNLQLCIKKSVVSVKNYVVSVKCVVSVKKYVVSVKCAVFENPKCNVLQRYKELQSAYSESHRSGDINDLTLQRNKEQNCWKDRWLSWRLYKLLSVLR
ncbi:hypothetical protein ANN_19998 [Periplaneta americana]|uniref:Reverse transcriptase domain-containing protein n=1 Tax=Periplaneta americana TaxID=6978 RepID=A0ABQ8SC28_PERAM|nr:hypothetical protein ANN_19998 [Periplaneta americana]